MPGRRDYHFERQLGRGSFGVVHKVTRKADGQQFVCKEINLRGLKAQAREEAHQEVTLLRRVSSGSTYIVQYVESFLERESLHIVMEFCEHGDLSQYLKARRGVLLAEEEIWKFLLQVGLGLRWLHSNRILHRDIKTLNVFLTATYDARLGDLGVARVLSEGTNFASTIIGTPYYLSPELCEGVAYNDRSDVWAYGCVIFEMCALRQPFVAANQMALLAKILSGRRDAPLSAQFSQDLHDLVDSCLQHEAERRPSVEALLRRQASRRHARELQLELELEAQPPVGDASAVVGRVVSLDMDRAEARRRWTRLQKEVTVLHDAAVKGLDAPARLAWDSLYRLLRAKMGADQLSDVDRGDIEKHIFEDLPPEHTELISKVVRILPLEQECAEYQAFLSQAMGPSASATAPLSRPLATEAPKAATVAGLRRDSAPAAITKASSTATGALPMLRTAVV